MPRSAMWARVFQTFWPVMTHSSPSRTARVDSPARSDPDPGSLNSWHHDTWPVNVFRSRRSRSSSDPWVTTVGPAMVSPKNSRAPGPWAPASPRRRSASRWSPGGRPRPPWPSGKPTQASPRSYWRERNSSTGTVRGSSSSKSWPVRSCTRDASSAMPRPYCAGPPAFRFDVPGPARVGSGLEAGDAPPVAIRGVPEPVVQAVVALLPELEGDRGDPHPAPPRGPRHGLSGVLGLELLHPAVEGGTVLDGPTLPGRMGADLAGVWPGGEVGVGLLCASPVGRSLDPHLAAQRLPVEQEGGMGVLGQLMALGAVVVGEERESIDAPGLEQHHAHRRTALGIGGGHGHGFGAGRHGRRPLVPSTELDQRIGIDGAFVERLLHFGHATTLASGRAVAPASGRAVAPASGRAVAQLASAVVPGPIDVETERSTTPGCRGIAHLNNAGAALATQATLDAVVGHLRREAAQGGYEAAASVAHRLVALRSSAARLLGADDGDVVVTGSDTQSWTKALWSFALA